MKILHFTAEWCGPCQMMKPMINKVLTEYPDIEYVPIDIDENNQIAVDYQIMSLPTFIVFQNEEQTARFSGGMTKSKFIESIGI